MQKITLEDGQSANIIDENIAELKAMFPDAFTESGVNFDVLRQLLGDAEVLDEGEEKYGLNWYGKKQARQIALIPSAGTLLPKLDQSEDWEKTSNVFIEGDNLEALKILQKSYAGSVRFIYIDPPYNTDGDFIYPDRYSEGLDSYLHYTGQKVDGDWVVSESGRERTGRKHTLWLNMMLPRLRLARNLLSKDGVIAIHLDEHEFSNASLLLAEVFGEENNLGPIIWDKKNPKGDASKIAVQHEYVLLYAKNLEYLKECNDLKRPKANAERMLKKAQQAFSKIGSKVAPDDLLNITKQYDIDIDISKFEKKYTLEDANSEYRSWLSKQDVSGGEAAYKYIDSNGDVYRTVSMAWPNKKTAPDDYFIPLIHPTTQKPCPVPDRGWRNPPATMKTLLAAGQIVFGDDETKQPERKYLLKDNMSENIPSVLPYGGSDDALLTKIGIPFDNPKPVQFAKSLIKFFAGSNGLVLDFFAGSATTGHACMELNALDGHSNKFILVQLPEKIDPSKAEQKAAASFCKKNALPLNIAEISKERLRRARNHYKSAKSESDIGFRVFELSSSNLLAWNPVRNDLEGTLLKHKESLLDGRSENDVLYELLLKRGVELTAPVDARNVCGKDVYCVGFGVLFACLNASIKASEVDELANGILAWHKELEPETDSHVFFRDSAFADDIAKSNMVAILEQNGISHVRSL